jgi:hypothetical protein
MIAPEGNSEITVTLNKKAMSFNSSEKETALYGNSNKRTTKTRYY